MKIFTFSHHSLERMPLPERDCTKFGAVATILFGETGVGKNGAKTATMTDAALATSPLATDSSALALRGLHVVYDHNCVITVWRQPLPNRTLIVGKNAKAKNFECREGRRLLRLRTYIDSLYQ